MKIHRAIVSSLLLGTATALQIQSRTSNNPQAEVTLDHEVTTKITTAHEIAAATSAGISNAGNTQGSDDSLLRKLIDVIEALLGGVGVDNPPNGTNIKCGDVMVVFARGTNEIPTLGEVVGPELQVALQAALESTNKSLTFTGVHYSATILGYLQGGAATGSVEMARQLTLAANLCPKAAIVAVGYSQGAQLVHNSMRFLASVVSERIKAVVLFGDPDNGQALQGIDVSRVQTICHVGDPICEGGNLLQILLMDAQHLNYKVDVPGTVDFIVARV